MTLSIMLTLLFLIAFIEGFVFMWFMMDDIGEDVVFGTTSTSCRNNAGTD